MASQSDVRAVELQIEAAAASESYADSYDPLGFGTPPYVPTDQSQLSMWDSFLGSITPKSFGEAMVDRIYGDPANTLQRDPQYNRADLSSPNVWVQAKGAVTDTVSAITGFAKFGVIGVVGIILAAIVLHAAVTSYVRR